MSIRKNQFYLLLLIIILQFNNLAAQTGNTQSGINFQGVARSSGGVVLASQNIAVRLSIISGTATGNTEYQETKTVTTNAQGLFNIIIGDGTASASVGTYTNINWQLQPKFVKIEMDPAAGSNFVTLGTTQLQYVAYAYYANAVPAENLIGLVPVARGGTGSSDLASLKTNLGLGNVNNTTDANKPISAATQTALNNKINIADSVSAYVTPTQLSRISFDTSSLSNRINLKANTSSLTTSLDTKENLSNKSTAADLGGASASDILYPTQKAVKDYVTANSASGGVADGGITTIKIASGAVTDAKLTLTTPNLGTPSALVGTNITGTASGLSIGGNAATATTANTAINASYATSAGTASNVTTNANLTGVVTSVGNTTSIANGAITNEMLAGSIAASKLVGTDITTLGTITSGTWNGSIIGSNIGGAGSVNGLLKANGSGIVSSAGVNDIPDLSSKYISTNDGSQPPQNTNIILSGGGNFGNDITVSGQHLGIGNDRNLEHNNLAFGKNALFTNYGSIGNTSIGSNSSLTTNGNNNTALGVYSNSGIPDGFEFDNIHFGDNNTAIGAYALTHNNNFVYYPDFGYSANEIYHSSNTAIGAYALSNIINGYSNVSIGVNAGKNITNGFKNILIGDSAGNNTTNQYTNAMALGVKAPLRGNNTIQLGSDGSNGGTAITHVYTSGKIISGNLTYPNIAGTNGQILTVNNGTLTFRDLPSTSNLIQNSTTLSSPQNASISISGSLTTTQDALINGSKFGRGGGNINTNNAIGFNALNSNTTGYANIGIGYNALNFNTYGANNIAIGKSSQYFNNGQNNISLGTETLFSNTTGNSNTAIGNSSLKSNLSGSDNISIGSSSLLTNSSGNNNIALGANALSSNTLGNQNIAIGNYALHRNTLGNNNIALGEYAMSSNTTGSYNVAINGQANGTYNTAIGWGTNVHTGSNSTAIGYGASNYGESNLIVLGDGNIAKVITSGKMQLGGVLYPNTTAPSGAVLMMGNNSEAYWATLPVNVIDITSVSNSVNLNTASITSLTNSVNSNTASITSLTNSVNSNTASITSLTNSVNLNLNNTVPYSGANRGVDLGNYDLRVNGLIVGSGNESTNTVLGKNALVNNTTGIFNVAIGQHSLVGNSTGFYNVAIGPSALQNNGIGASNIAIGYSTLSGNNNGLGNIGLGSYALTNNYSGNNNFAFGTFSLAANTTGSNNIAIGNQTLNTNSTGSRNIQIGGSSNNTTGSGNVSIGGMFLGPVSNMNTAIGSDAGINGIYTNTTVIGYGAGANQSNSVFLGNSDVTNVISSGSFYSSSDRRLKKNIEKIPYGLNTLIKLNPVRFKFIKNNHLQIGFIAQEIQSLIPELVSGKEGDVDKGETLSVNYSHMVALLTKALQEEDSKVEKLKQETIELKKEIENLKEKLGLMIQKK